MDLLKKYWKQILGVAAIAAVSYGVKCLLDQADEPDKGGKDSEEEKSNEGDKKTGINKDTIKNGLDKEGHLSKEVIFQILEKSMEKASLSFAKLTKDNRQNRRPFFDRSELNQYVNLIVQYFNNLQLTMKRSQKEVCESLDVSDDLVEKSMENFAKTATQEDMLKMQNFQIKLQESLKSQKQATIDQYKESMKFRIKFITEKQDMIRDILKITVTEAQKLESPEETPALINAAIGIIVSDLVYQNFKLEDEDFHQTITDNSQLIQNDQEIEILTQQFQQNLVLLLQNLFQFMPQ